MFFHSHWCNGQIFYQTRRVFLLLFYQGKSVVLKSVFPPGSSLCFMLKPFFNQQQWGYAACFFTTEDCPYSQVWAREVSGSLSSHDLLWLWAISPLLSLGSLGSHHHLCGFTGAMGSVGSHGPLCALYGEMWSVRSLGSPLCSPCRLGWVRLVQVCSSFEGGLILF